MPRDSHRSSKLSVPTTLRVQSGVRIRAQPPVGQPDSLHADDLILVVFAPVHVRTALRIGASGFCPARLSSSGTSKPTYGQAGAVDDVRGLEAVDLGSARITVFKASIRSARAGPRCARAECNLSRESHLRGNLAPPLAQHLHDLLPNPSRLPAKDEKLLRRGCSGHGNEALSARKPVFPCVLPDTFRWGVNPH